MALLEIGGGEVEAEGVGELALFFQGSPDVDYETTMSFLDLARSSGAKNIGIIVEAAQ